MHITILDPDDPSGSPAYDGPVSGVHLRLIPGVYQATTDDDVQTTTPTVSDELDFCHDGRFAETMADLSLKYGVGFIVRKTNGPGWPVVSVAGPRHLVIECIATQWDDGGGSSRLFAESMCGNESARVLWNQGIPDRREVEVTIGVSTHDNDTLTTTVRVV